MYWIKPKLKIRIQTLFDVNPTQLDPFLDLEGQPDPFEPKNWAQNWVEPKKRVWFGRTRSSLTHLRKETQ